MFYVILHRVWLESCNQTTITQLATDYMDHGIQVNFTIFQERIAWERAARVRVCKQSLQIDAITLPLHPHKVGGYKDILAQNTSVTLRFCEGQSEL